MKHILRIIFVIVLIVTIFKSSFAQKPEMLAQIERLSDKKIPLIDYHIHLRGGMTAEKAFDWQQKTGVKSGVLENAGRDWPLSDNEKIAAFITDARRFPLLIGLQVNDRDWFREISSENLRSLDYFLADTMIMNDKSGKPQKLWLETEYEIDDPENWLIRYFEHCMTVVNEPITILANPTYLPPRMEKYYDSFWNEERMTKLIDAAIANGVALEIQAATKFPNDTFIELAKKKGAKFTIGRNNHTDKPDDLKRSLDLIEKHDLKSAQFLIKEPPKI